MNQLKKEKLYQKWFKVMDFQFLKKKKKTTTTEREKKNRKDSLTNLLATLTLLAWKQCQERKIPGEFPSE